MDLAQTVALLGVACVELPALLFVLPSWLSAERLARRFEDLRPSPADRLEAGALVEVAGTLGVAEPAAETLDGAPCAYAQLRLTRRAVVHVGEQQARDTLVHEAERRGPAQVVGPAGAVSVDLAQATHVFPGPAHLRGPSEDMTRDERRALHEVWGPRASHALVRATHLDEQVLAAGDQVQAVGTATPDGAGGWELSAAGGLLLVSGQHEPELLAGLRRRAREWLVALGILQVAAAALGLQAWLGLPG